MKSVNGIKCFCCGNVCQSIWNSKCMGMCVHVPLCPHGDFVLPLLLSTCPPLMPSLLHLGCRSMSLANPGVCDICHANDTHTHKQIKINNTDTQFGLFSQVCYQSHVTQCINERAKQPITSAQIEHAPRSFRHMHDPPGRNPCCLHLL